MRGPDTGIEKTALCGMDGKEGVVASQERAGIVALLSVLTKHRWISSESSHTWPLPLTKCDRSEQYRCF